MYVYVCVSLCVSLCGDCIMKAISTHFNPLFCIYPLNKTETSENTAPFTFFNFIEDQFKSSNWALSLIFRSVVVKKCLEQE